MRYLIDEEFRKAKREAPRPMVFPYAANLRHELSDRNIRWAIANGHAHEISMGKVPAVLFREDESGNHGNFLPETYRRIQQTPAWNRRLSKVHTSARKALQSHDPGRMEVDSSNSSDALLMNVFCHPDTPTAPAVRELIGLNPGVQPVFGYRPGVPLSNGRRDCTEIDMVLGDLLVEAKLTEYDFQTAPWRLIERYRDLKDVFDIDLLEVNDGVLSSYQLIRSVLAVYAVPGRRFCVLCDRRRPDLIDSWYRVMTAVKPYELRCRLQLLTWQELAAVLPTPLSRYLEERYGVMAVN
jgi:hypothetical protein